MSNMRIEGAREGEEVNERREVGAGEAGKSQENKKKS